MVTKRDDDNRPNIEQSASGRLEGRVLQLYIPAASDSNTIHGESEMALLTNSNYMLFTPESIVNCYHQSRSVMVWF